MADNINDPVLHNGVFGVDVSSDCLPDLSVYSTPEVAK